MTNELITAHLTPVIMWQVAGTSFRGGAYSKTPNSLRARGMRKPRVKQSRKR